MFIFLSSLLSYKQMPDWRSCITVDYKSYLAAKMPYFHGLLIEVTDYLGS